MLRLSFLVLQRLRSKIYESIFTYEGNNYRYVGMTSDPFVINTMLLEEE